MIINLFGAPNSGKSLLASDLYSYLSKLGRSAELVGEYAKELVWDNRTHLLKCNQMLLLGEQIRRVDMLREQVEFVICDSPILLSKIYGRFEGEHFIKFTEEVFDRYDNFNVLLPLDEKYFTCKGRVHNLAQSKKIQKEILNLNPFEPYYHYDNDLKLLATNIIAKELETTDSLRRV